jgi:hypothetical protein
MLPAIFPEVKIAKADRGGRAMTVSSLCDEAQIPCRVTGPAADRVVYLRQTAALEASREPGAFGVVSIGVPAGKEQRRAVLALGILAYAVFDYTARESMRGRPEAQLARPVGRPRKAVPLSGAERQRRWRSKH